MSLLNDGVAAVRRLAGRSHWKTGASEDALRTATMTGRIKSLPTGDIDAPNVMFRAAKPDH